MKSAALLLAELRSRGLAFDCNNIADRHHVTLEQVLEPSHQADVVRARHAIWTWQVEELGSASAVARLWGVDHSSILGATAKAASPIVYVLLGELESGGEHYRFSYFAGRERPYAIANIHTGKTTWWSSYDEAREFWQEALDLAGSTFRAAANAAIEPATVRA